MKLDVELLSAIALETTDRVKLILEYLPKEESNRILIHNIAAIGIHLAFFMSELTGENFDAELSRLKKEFLNQCECKNHE